ncbi:unnamed protein product [Sphagnum balticum]
MAAAVMGSRPLPHDALVKVLVRLPYKTLACFRVVCKEWNALITSKSFYLQILSVENAQQKPFLLRILPHDFSQVMAYNPTRMEWRSLCLAFLEPIFKSQRLVATGGGLLCFYGTVNDGAEEEDSSADNKKMSRLLVCNPITKSWGILPHLEEALSLDDAKAKVLAFDETSKSFKLFLADVQHGDNDSGVIFAHVYNSATHSWTTTSTAMEQRYTITDDNEDGVLVNGSVHWTTSRMWRVGDRQGHTAGMSFDIQSLNSKTFANFHIPYGGHFRFFHGAPPGGVPKLLELQGQLSIVVHDRLLANSQLVFQQDTKGEWEVIKILPPDSSLTTTGSAATVSRYRCLGQGEFLFFTGAVSDDDGSSLISYNLLETAWRSIVNPPPGGGGGGDGGSGGSGTFSVFHPSLHVV